MSVAFNRIQAVKQGKPSWLTFREAGLLINKSGLTFDDEAFYSGPIGIACKVQTRVRNALKDFDSVMAQLNERHQRELKILNKIFKVEGVLKYEVEFRRENDELIPYLKVKSRSGLGEKFNSRADKDFLRAADNKANTINGTIGQLAIFVTWANPKIRGEEFTGKHYIAIPHYVEKDKAEVVLLLGEFDETYDSNKKIEIFKDKFENLKRFAADSGLILTDKNTKQIENNFKKISWKDFFEEPLQSLLEKYIVKNL